MNLNLTSFITLRRLYDDDEFFDEGNEQRELYSKCSVVSLQEQEQEQNDNDNDNDNDNMNIEQEQDTTQHFHCNIDTCNRHFQTATEYASHYAVQHRYRCATCCAVLPNSRLLDMHIEERHDSFFAAMASRKPSYKCLVHSCTTLFANSYERSLHLQTIHLFPKNFCYDRQKRTKTQRRTKTKTQTKMKTNGSSTNQNSNQSSNGYVTSNVDELSNQMSQISFGRKKKNRQQHWSKKKRTTTKKGDGDGGGDQKSKGDTSSTVGTTFGDITRGGVGSTANAVPKLNRRQRRALARAEQEKKT